MRVLALILGISFAVDAWAACTPMPSCEELNYTDTNCDGEYITCPFDSAKKKCLSSKIDCAALGYTNENKSNWCGKEVSCPTDTSLTLCAEAYENPCPNGYDNRILSVEDCGEQGSNGWTYTSTTIPGNDGQDIRCGKCTPKSCSGYYARYQSASDCGTGVSAGTGWIYKTCYEGDQKLGSCTKKTCSYYGLHDPSDRNNGKLLCKGTATNVYLGDASSPCYSCVNCLSAKEFTDGMHKSYVYQHQSGIDRCKVSASENRENGLYGCYAKSFPGTYTTNGDTYTGQCDSCYRIGTSVAYNSQETFCCLNGSYRTTGANWSCPTY